MERLVMKKLYDLIGKVGGNKVRVRHEYRDIQLNWDTVFGALSKDLEFGYVNEKCLVVYAVNPSWVTEIAYFEKDFLEKINRLLPSKRHYLEKISVKLQRRKPKAPIQKKIEKKVVSTSLDINIKQKYKKRIDMGYKPCKKCDIVLTLNNNCIFCENSL